MATWKVQVWREWKEFGELEVEADSEAEATEEAREALNSDEPCINWDEDRVEPGNQDVESVEEF